jgi:ferric-dicitrate binding protein FerR (iron transport regulator)
MFWWYARREEPGGGAEAAAEAAAAERRDAAFEDRDVASLDPRQSIEARRSASESDDIFLARGRLRRSVEGGL